MLGISGSSRSRSVAEAQTECNEVEEEDNRHGNDADSFSGTLLILCNYIYSNTYF